MRFYENMYPLISRISFIIRFLICWFTIDQYPFFSNEAIQRIIGQILSIYTILWLICYVITGVASSKLGIKTPTGRSIVYFLIYLPLVAITYGILRGLTKLHILPI